MNNKKIELLAPAGEFKAFFAAINSGADSVYIGGKNFGARAFSDNFDEDDLKFAVKYAHNKDVLVYVTVNTLIKDTEMLDAINYCIYLARIGVDAVIVQDYGLMYLINKFIPELKINVSTQAVVYDEHGVNFFDFENINKVILAREVSLKDIKRIRKNTEVDLEAFIHGALCNSYSGQCYLSSFLGGRSGNRGKCAQPCRLNYSYVNENGRVEKFSREKPLLSLKDYKVGSSVGEMIDAGISACKIEGRMKSYVYTSAIVEYYRALIDNHMGVNISDEYLRDVEDNMKEVFNRSYSDAYLTESNESMFAMTSSGVRGKRVEELKKNYEDRSKAFSKKRRKLIDMQLYAEEGKKIALFVNDDNNNEVCVVSENVCEGSLGVITTKEVIIEQLAKLGDSYYEPRTIDVELGEGVFIRKSTLNKLRREAVMQLFEKTNENHELENIKYMSSAKLAKVFITDEKENESDRQAKISVKINKLEELEFIDYSKVYRVYFPLNLNYKNINKYNELLENIEEKYLYLPNIMNNSIYKEASNVLDQIKYFNGICVNNIGSINYFSMKYDLPIHVGYFFNIMNSYALLAYASKNVKSATVSVENNINDIKSMNKNIDFTTEVVAHAHVKLMSSKNCPFSTLSKCQYKMNCEKCKYNYSYKLKDRMNKDFYFQRTYGISNMYNCLPLSIIGKSFEFRRANVDYYMLDTLFLDNPELVIEKLYDEINDNQNKKYKLEENTFTRGHYFKTIL